MRRRDLIVAVGGGAVLCPLVRVGAQSQKPVIGLLQLGSPEPGAPNDPFVEELARLGYVDGQSIVIEVRWARGDITRYPKLARELMDRSPSVIVAACGPSLRAIRELSRTVPVVAMCADEKNFLGEVASLRRPAATRPA